VFHHKLPQYATNSTMGSRTDLTRIEPTEKAGSGQTQTFKEAMIEPRRRAASWR
jgi:hypothetical protein